jgi:hypothetical protein
MDSEILTSDGFDLAAPQSSSCLAHQAPPERKESILTLDSRIAGPLVELPV